jgi:hypothetical protein
MSGLVAFSASLRLATADEIEHLHHVLCEVRLVQKVSGFGRVTIPIKDGLPQNVATEVSHRVDLRPRMVS